MITPPNRLPFLIKPRPALNVERTAQAMLDGSSVDSDGLSFRVHLPGSVSASECGPVWRAVDEALAKLGIDVYREEDGGRIRLYLPKLPAREA